MQLIIMGEGLDGLHNEAGGHRFQRVPPTERKGRVHTSTVTVAVLNESALGTIAGPWSLRRDQDFRVEWFSGSGAGGQHRNKHQNCCRYIHVPTGTVVKVEGRERTKNMIYAKEEMKKRLDSMGNLEYTGRLGQIRKDQVGSGQRGDKVRTIRMQADEAVDHRTGKRIRAQDYLEGKMDRLW